MDERQQQKKRGRKPRRGAFRKVSFEMDATLLDAIAERAEQERTSQTAILKAAVACYLRKQPDVAAVQELKAGLERAQEKLNRIGEILKD